MLPAGEILEKASTKSYEELAVEYGISRGSIWRLLKQHNALKYKESCLKKFKSVVTGLWACPRPTGQYRGNPGGFRSFGPNLTVPCPSTDGCLTHIYLDLIGFVQLVRTGNKSWRL